MHTIRLKIADLLELTGQMSAGSVPDVAELTPIVMRHYAFLPHPLIVTIEGEEVVLQFPEESNAAQTEAARLAQKGAKRAAEGDYEKAIGIFKRVLELQPSLHSARRDLAMAYVEIGEVENAQNHLIEVLRLDPKDAWSWVVIANLYIREKSDPETGEKFLRKALELKPDDAWALNSLAAVCYQTGRHDDAVANFERAIAVNPDFVNAYYGEAMVFESTNQPDKALETLNRLFARAKMQDVRSKPVYDNARLLFTKLQNDLAVQTQSDAFKCVQNYKAEMEVLSGYPVRIEETDFEDKAGARLQIAWKHRRNYHLISTRRAYAPELLCHLEAHELTHLRMESEARIVGKNQFFTTTSQTRETAMRSLAGDIRRLEKAGYSEDSITKVTLSLINGLCGFLFNCPLDMLIERHIHGAFPVLHASQYLSVRTMALEAWQVNSDPEIWKITPQKVLKSSLALNGAYSLFLDDLFSGVTAFAHPYKRLDSFSLSERLYKHWQERSLSFSHIEGGGASIVSSTSLRTSWG